MYTGNPHQDRTGAHERVHGGSMPKATWQKPAPWQGDAPWITRPPEKFWNDGTPFKQNPPEKFWNDGTLSNDPNMIQLLNTGEHESSHLTGGPLAELTQDQMDFMGSPYNTPAFGVSKEDLWNRTKGMEKKGFFGWGAQEPTTQQEFNDYYNQLEQGESGSWLAMAGKKKGPLATVPGSVVAPNVPEHTGFSDDLFKQDPLRSYSSGYRYNNSGLQPLYFG